jgi:hypothetical protein
LAWYASLPFAFLSAISIFILLFVDTVQTLTHLCTLIAVNGF